MMLLKLLLLRMLFKFYINCLSSGKEVYWLCITILWWLVVTGVFQTSLLFGWVTIRLAVLCCCLYLRFCFFNNILDIRRSYPFWGCRSEGFNVDSFLGYKGLPVEALINKLHSALIAAQLCNYLKLSLNFNLTKYDTGRWPGWIAT